MGITISKIEPRILQANKLNQKLYLSGKDINNITSLYLLEEHSKFKTKTQFSYDKSNNIITVTIPKIMNTGKYKLFFMNKNGKELIDFSNNSHIYFHIPVKMVVSVGKLEVNPNDNSYYKVGEIKKEKFEFILKNDNELGQIFKYKNNSYVGTNNLNNRNRTTTIIKFKIILNKDKDIKNLPEPPTTTTSKPTTTTTTTTTLPPLPEKVKEEVIVIPNDNNSDFTNIRENYNDTIEKYEMIEEYNTALSSHYEGFSICDSINLTKLINYLKLNHKTYNDIYIRNTSTENGVTTTTLQGLISKFHATYLNNFIKEIQKIVDYEIEKGRCDLNLDCRVSNHFYNFNQLFKDIIEKHIETVFATGANPNLINELRKGDIDPTTLINELNDTLKEISKLFLVNIRFLASIEITVG